MSLLNSDIPLQYEALSVHNAIYIYIQCFHRSLVFQCSLFNTKTEQFMFLLSCKISKVMTCWKMNHSLISHCAAVKIHSFHLSCSCRQETALCVTYGSIKSFMMIVFLFKKSKIMFPDVLFPKGQENECCLAMHEHLAGLSWFELGSGCSMSLPFQPTIWQANLSELLSEFPNPRLLVRNCSPMCR